MNTTKDIRPVGDVTTVTLQQLSNKLDAILVGQARAAQRFFSVKAAAEYSSLSEASIRRLVSAGKLTPLRPCKGKVLIDRRQLDGAITSSTSTPRTGRGFRTGTTPGD